MHCYFCHGYSGDAKTAASGYLTPPPRNFTTTSPDKITREQMIAVVREGKAGTAMMSFSRQLDADDIAAVVDFVRENFMQQQLLNTRYHIEANGWQHFQRYAAAFPFVDGSLALDLPEEQLDEKQLQGKQLFLSTCIVCHEGRSLQQPDSSFEARAVSYPRAGYSHKKKGVDETSGATPYARHDKPPMEFELSESEKRGEKIFQKNCAFCHAADGSGQNWIGSFLEPHPRNLQDRKAMQGMTRQRLKSVIENGLKGTTMPAWKTVLDEQQIEAIINYVSRVFYRLDD